MDRVDSTMDLMTFGIMQALLTETDCARNSDNEYMKKYLIISLPYTAQGDYVGSTVEMVNRRYFTKEYNFVERLYQDYSTRTAIIDFNETTYQDICPLELESLVDDINGLSDYPVIDDELISNLEHELGQEYIDDDLLPSFEGYIENRLYDEGFDFEPDKGLCALLFQKYFDKLNENCSPIVFETGATPYMDLDTITDQVTDEDLNPIIWCQFNTACIIDTEQRKFSFEPVSAKPTNGPVFVNEPIREED